jgi:hypothetical protein
LRYNCEHTDACLAAAHRRIVLAHGVSMSVHAGLNFQGSDIRGIQTSTPSVCAEACRRDARCHAFTLITAATHQARACWLKSKDYALGASWSAGTMSGVVRGAPFDIEPLLSKRPESTAEGTASKLLHAVSSKNGLRRIDRVAAICSLMAFNRSWNEDRLMCLGVPCITKAAGLMLNGLSHAAVEGEVGLIPPPTPRHTDVFWTRGMPCWGKSAWECLFGKSLSYRLDCGASSGGAPPVRVTDTNTLRAAWLFTWLLHTTKMEIPWSNAKSPDWSVHIRKGDSCGVTVYEERSVKHGGQWEGGYRRCIHESVYVRHLLGVIQGSARNQTRVFLATDSSDALAAMRASFRIVSNSGDRQRLYGLNEGGAAQLIAGMRGTEAWPERRRDNREEAMALTLADIRLVTAGQQFLSSKCSNFAQLAWLVASFRHGYWLPHHSVDECQ